MSNASKLPADSEVDLLTREAADAKKAVMNTLEKMRAELKNGVSPRELAVRHPLIALGATAVAGFVAASALTPAKDEAAKEKFARMQAAILKKLTPTHDEKPPTNGRSDAHDNGKTTSQRDGSSLLGVVFRHAFTLLKPAIISAITAAVSARVAPAPERAQPVSDDDTVRI